MFYSDDLWLVSSAASSPIIGKTEIAIGGEGLPPFPGWENTCLKVKSIQWKWLKHFKKKGIIEEF